MIKVQSLKETIQQVTTSVAGTTWTIEVSNDGLIFKNNIGESFEVRSVPKPDPTGFRQITRPWLTAALEQHGSPTKIARAYGWDTKQFSNHIVSKFGYKHSETKIAARNKILQHYESAKKSGLPLDVALLASHYKVSPSRIYAWFEDYENGKILPDKRGRKLNTDRRGIKAASRKKAGKPKTPARPLKAKTKSKRR
jgi:hypothetical protein